MYLSVSHICMYCSLWVINAAMYNVIFCNWLKQHLLLRLISTNRKYWRSLTNAHSTLMRTLITDLFKSCCYWFSCDHEMVSECCVLSHKPASHSPSWTFEVRQTVHLLPAWMHGINHMILKLNAWIILDFREGLTLLKILLSSDCALPNSGTRSQCLLGKLCLRSIMRRASVAVALVL